MSTLSNAEFIRRMRQGKVGSYSPETTSDFSNQAYFDTYMSGQMLSSPSDANLNFILNNLDNYSYQEPSLQEPETVEDIEKQTNQSINTFKRLADTTDEIGYNFVKGIGGFIEGVFDFVVGAAGEIGSWFGADDKWAKDTINYDLSSRIAQGATNLSLGNIFSGETFNADNWDFSDSAVQNYNQELHESSFLNEAPDWLHDGVNAVSESIGRMVPSILLAVATGGTSLGATLGSKAVSVGSMAVSAAGSGTQEALSEGENVELGQALLFGVASGAIEGATEYVFSGLGKVGSKIASTSGKTVKSILPNSVSGFFGKQVSKNFAGQLTAEFIEEGAEEVMSDVLQPLVKSIYNGKSVSENYAEYDPSSALESFLLGGITSMVMGGSNRVYSRIKNGKAVSEASKLVNDIANDYDRLINLQESGRALSIASNGDVSYNAEARAIVDEMTNKVAEHTSMVNKMSAREKEKYFKLLTGQSVNKGFKNIENELNTITARYNELVENGESNEVMRKFKENYIDRIADMVNEGKEKWATQIINERVDSFAPKTALTLKTDVDNKLFRRHLRNYFKHSSERNSSQISNDLSEIKKDLELFEKNATNEERISFGKQIARFNDYFDNARTDDEALKVFNEFVDSFKDSNVKEQIIRYRLNNVSQKLDINTKISFENGTKSGIPARYDPAQNKIVLNNAYADDKIYAKSIAHEYVGHLIYDSFSTTRIERNKIVDRIKNTEWFKNIKDNFEKTYDLVGEENSELYKSELFANYLEHLIESENVSLDEVLESIDTRKFITPLRRAIKSLNKSSAYNEVIKELHTFLRKGRNLAYDIRVAQLKNEQSAYSKSALMDENTVEKFIADNYKKFAKVINLEASKTGRRAFEVNDMEFEINEYERYLEEGDITTENFKVSGNVFANFIREVINMDPYDLDYYDSDFEDIKLIFAQYLNKSISYLKSNYSLTIDDFKSAYSLYQYATKKYLPTEIEAFDRKFAGQAKRNEEIESVDEFEWEDDFGNFFEIIDEFNNVFALKMKDTYGFDVIKGQYIEKENSTEVNETRIEEFKDISEDINTQLEPDEKVDMEVIVDNTVEKLEEANEAVKTVQNVVENIKNTDTYIQNIALENANIEETQDFIHGAVESLNNLADKIASFKVGDMNLLEIVENILGNGYVINEKGEKVSNTDFNKEAFATYVDDAIPEFVVFADNVINSLLTTKKNSNSLCYSLPDVVDLNSNTFKTKNISSQEIAQYTKAVSRVNGNLHHFIFDPLKALNNEINKIEGKDNKGNTIDYDSAIEEFSYKLSQSESDYVDNLASIQNEYSDIFQYFKTQYEELSTSKTSLSTILSFKDKESKQGRKLLTSLGKYRDLTNRYYYNYHNVFDKVESVGEISIKGMNKTGVEKTLNAKVVSKDTYDKLISNGKPSIYAISESLSSNKSKAHANNIQYVLVEDEINGEKNLSGFSYNAMRSSATTGTIQLVINSAFNFGNNTLYLENIGYFVDSMIKPYKNRAKTSGVVLQLDFYSETKNAVIARDTLANFYLYPYARIEETDYRIIKKGDKEKGKQTEELLNVNRFSGVKYNIVYIYDPQYRKSIPNLESSKLAVKIGKTTDEKHNVYTRSSLTRFALKKSREQTEQYLDKMIKDRRRNIVSANYEKNRVERVSRASYRSGVKTGIKQGVKTAEEVLKKEYAEREQRLINAQKLLAENEKLFEGMINSLEKVGLGKRQYFGDLRRDAYNRYIRENKIDSEKITEEEKQLAKIFANKVVKEARNNWKETLINTARMLNTYVSNKAEVNFNFKPITSKVYQKNYVSFLNTLENGAGKELFYEIPPNVEFNYAYYKSKTPIPTEGEGVKDPKYATKLAPSSIRANFDNVVTENFADSAQKVSTELVKTENLMQEKINKDDPTSVKLKKIKNNIQYSDKITAFENNFINQQAGLEKALISIGVSKTDAESFSHSLRSAKQIGSLNLKEGMPIYDNEYKLQTDKKTGVIKRTRSMAEASKLILDIFDKLDAGDKKIIDRWRNRDYFNNDQNRIMRDLYNSMILQHAVDTNIAFHNAIRGRLGDFIKDNGLNETDFKNSLDYIDAQVKTNKNVNFGKLEAKISLDLTSYYVKEVGNAKNAKEVAKTSKFYKSLVSDMSSIFDNLQFKDVYGITLPKEVFSNEHIQFFTELNNLLVKKDKSGKKLLDDIKERLENKSDLFLEEYEEILERYETFDFGFTDTLSNEEKELYKKDPRPFKEREAKFNEEKRRINGLIKYSKNMFERPTNERMLAEKKKIDDFYADNKITEFSEVKKIFRENLDQALNYRVANKLLSEEEAAIFKRDYPNYVPLSRVKVRASSSGSSLDIEHSVFNRVGSNEAIQPINDLIVKQISNLPFQAAVQEMFSYAYNYKTKDSPLITFHELDEKENRITNVFEQDINDFASADLMSRGIRFYQENNEIGRYIVEAKLIESGLNGIVAQSTLSYNINPLSSSVNIFKKLVTSWSPFFIVTNFTRDFADSLFTTKNGTVNFLKNLPIAFKEIISKNKSEMWDKFISNGGMSASYFSTNNSANTIRNLARETKEIKWYNFGKQVERANSVIEILFRFNEFELSYKRLKAAKLSDETVIRQALTDSADITTDFSRGGGYTKWLNRNLVPFLNAQVQGFSKVVRYLISPRTLRQWSALIFKAFVLGLGVDLLNELLLAGDDDYEALPDFTKESYYLIKAGDGNFIKIPRGRVMGTISSLFRNAVDMFFGRNTPIEAAQDFFETASTNLAPVDVSGGINYIFKPFTDASKNMTWYGQTIDKQSDLTKRPSERYDSETSEIAKFIGKTFNWSPKRIDYILAQSTGVVGDILLPLSTSGSSVGDTLLNFVKQNTSVSVIDNNKYAGEFYDYRTEIQYQANEGNLVSSKVYGYLSKCIDEINQLEEQLANATSEDERYVISLTIREAYQQAIKNAEALKIALSKLDTDTLASNDRFAITQAYAETFGAEQALKYYSSTTYKKAQLANQIGVSYDDYYNMYFLAREAESKDEARSIIREYVGIDESKIAAMLKLVGISLNSSERELANRYLKGKISSEDLAFLGFSSK